MLKQKEFERLGKQRISEVKRKPNKEMFSNPDNPSYGPGFH